MCDLEPFSKIFWGITSIYWQGNFGNCQAISKHHKISYLFNCLLLNTVSCALNRIVLWKWFVATCFTFSIKAMVQGYHVYQSVWEAVDDEVLECSREIGNHSDHYAVAVVKNSREAGGRVTVSHVCTRFHRLASYLCNVEVLYIAW